jgi:uncharacterized protein (TIGR00730 family)
MKNRANNNMKGHSTPGSGQQLAYENHRFMENVEGRPLRILAEYLEPRARLAREKIENTVVFFGSARTLPRDVATENLRKLEAAMQDRGGSASPGAGLPNNHANGQDEAKLLKAARMAVEMSRYYEESRELSRMITAWSLSLQKGKRFIVVCSGGGPGIMEAANRGAAEAGGVSIGLNIKLPFEQESNPYVTPQLNFLFKYFFMRKLWFAQPSRALIVFPGGFGTFDELFEILTLIETHKLGHHAIVLLYGSDYWKRAVSFDWLMETGTISADEMTCIRYADTPQQAFDILTRDLRRNRAMRAAFRHPFP